MNKTEQVSVLFSGGSDSTLAAALCCPQFKKVHLLTFHHSGMSSSEKSKVNAKRLQDKFGKDRITHKLIDIEEIFQKLYYGTYFRDLKRYGMFLTAATCNVCLLAMHTQVAIYSLENQIRFACDGYKQEKKHVYITMANKGVELLKEFYRKYDINYFNPVYNILRTDWELYDLGLTPKRNVKFPFEKLHYTAQHSCFHGILTNIYILGYYYQLYRKPSDEWVEYFKEKVEAAEKYVNEHINKNNLH